MCKKQRGVGWGALQCKAIVIKMLCLKKYCFLYFFLDSLYFFSSVPVLYVVLSCSVFQFANLTYS